jgi:hypothetical protein
MTDSLDCCFVLTPYDPCEGLTLQQAADRAKKSAGTIRNWCESEGIGRRIGGIWCVSKVALEMYLDGETAALARYLAGDRQAADVFNRFRLRVRSPVTLGC